jgi:cytochrome P450
MTTESTSEATDESEDSFTGELPEELTAAGSASSGSTGSVAEPMAEDWCREHFDHLSPQLAASLPETMERMRGICPVAHSDSHGGFFVATRYDEVIGAARDWESFTSTRGLAILDGPTVVRSLPVQADPPEQRIYKNLTNPFFTPTATASWEDGTRAIVTRLIDDFIEDGRCDFMASFAREFPSRAFFELALHAPPEDLEEVSRLASTSSIPNHPASRESWMGLARWIRGFVADRRRQGPRGDVVDAVIEAADAGRIPEDDAIGTIQLLILGGLETTAGALGLAMLRFCRQPHIADLLRAQPELMPKAVQELLRLEPPFVSVGRTATQDTELGGVTVPAGEKLLLHWASANRDEAEFEDPHEFRLDREHNRHVSFGMGVHRCTGSNLARFNLRIAWEEILRRMPDLRLDQAALEGHPIHYHPGLTRSPLTLPITFTPGPREGRPGGEPPPC